MLIASFVISVFAIVFSGTALTLTYRASAHRVHLELSPTDYGAVLGISNDSGINTTVRSIGYFRNSSQVTWINAAIGDYKINKNIALPFEVKARSTFETYINTMQNSIRLDKHVGFCVQLDTGRLYVITRKSPLSISVYMVLASWMSHLSGGRYALGLQRPRIKNY